MGWLDDFRTHFGEAIASNDMSYAEDLAVVLG